MKLLFDAIFITISKMYHYRLYNQNNLNICKLMTNNEKQFFGGIFYSIFINQVSVI